MLSLRRFHLELRRVTEHDIEEIRRGRNADFVRNNHIYRAEITPEQQQQWYKTTLSPYQYFFVICKQGRRIGLIHMSNIAPDLSRGEVGIFIWDPVFRASRVPLLALLTIFDFFFANIHLNKVEGKVLAANQAIIRFCHFFRFDLQPVANAEHLTICLPRQRYMAHREEFMAFARRVVHDPNAWELRLSGESSPLLLDAINKLL